MVVSRRSLLKLLLASAAAEVVDVEKLLWMPKSIITVPAMPVLEYRHNLGQLVAETWEEVMAKHIHDPFRDRWLLARLYQDGKGNFQASVEDATAAL